MDMKKIYGAFFLLLALLAPAALGQATSTTIMMYMCGTDLQSACADKRLGRLRKRHLRRNHAGRKRNRAGGIRLPV